MVFQVEVISSPDEADAACEVFGPAFAECYRKLDAQRDLGVPSIAGFLADLVAHEQEILRSRSGQVIAYQATDKGEVIGTVIVDVTELHKVYIRQIGVVPNTQRRGVGRALIAEVRRCHPERVLWAVTRRCNKLSQQFFQGLGFVLDESVLHEEYDPTRYVGLIER